MPTFAQGFELISGSKRPAVKWSDPATCRAPETFGGARYGLPTGPRNGVWVLDLDRGKVAGVDGLMSLTMHAGDREIPDTFTVRTPSGGMHLYFAWDPEHPVGNPVGVLPGVDVRGAGGYVCAGGDYVVAVDAPIVAAPEWLLDLVVRAAPQGPPGEVATAIGPEHPEWNARLEMGRRFVAGEPPCVSGQGGQAQLWKMALRLMRTYELPLEVAEVLLDPYNARCVPPWTEAEILRTLRRAAEEGQGPTGTFAATSPLLGGPSPALAPEAPPIPAPDEGARPWRQVPNPAHVYTFDPTVPSPAGKKVRLDLDELVNNFVGRSATPEWLGVWQYDTFRRRLLAVNPPMPLDAETVGLSERDFDRIMVWVQRRGATASRENVKSAINQAGALAEFHPVRDYLDALPKVSPERARAYFAGLAGRLWGALPERDELESGHLRRLAIAAVRRIRVPGTKVDTMLVLAGEQGLRKSLMCAKLFGEWFLDQLPPVASGRGHEASIAIEGRWGVEIAEMNALAGQTESAKKEFISRCVDKYRPVFGVAMQEVPRQCVFIGTTNADDFLTDPTGATRYDICDVREPIRLEELDRDAFWSAACALEAAGEAHYRDRANLARSGMAESAGYQDEDAWTDPVLKYAEGLAPAADGVRYVTAKGALTYGVLIPLEKQDKRVLDRVKSILRKAYGAASTRWVDGRAQRGYRVTDEGEKLPRMVGNDW